MKFWLVTSGEPLPIEPNEKPLRGALLAEALTKRGHHVTWWTTTFNHARKKHRFEGYTDLQVTPRLRLILLHSPVTYARNVSLRRAINHADIGRRFYNAARSAPAPDLILATFPLIELSAAAVRVGRDKRVPVVVDLRDMWPDIFVDAAPRSLQGAARPLLWPWFALGQRVFREASALTAISPGFLDWGLSRAGRARSDLDESFYLAHSPPIVSDNDAACASQRWADLGLSLSTAAFVCSYIGTMSSKLEMDTVIRAARLLDGPGSPFRFVLCGSGDEIERYKASARGLSNIMFPGWVNVAEVRALLDVSAVGLAPYRSRPDFMMSVPTKAIEYFATGLPVISSLRGALEDVIVREGCGLHYANEGAEALATALQRLLTNPAERARLSESALSAYQRLFHGPTVYGDMAVYLERIARSKRDGTRPCVAL